MQQKQAQSQAAGFPAGVPPGRGSSGSVGLSKKAVGSKARMPSARNFRAAPRHRAGGNARFDSGGGNCYNHENHPAGRCAPHVSYRGL